MENKMILKEIQDQNNSVNLKDFAKGMYFVNIKSSNKSKTYKIVKD